MKPGTPAIVYRRLCVDKARKPEVWSMTSSGWNAKGIACSMAGSGSRRLLRPGFRRRHQVLLSHRLERELGRIEGVRESAPVAEIVNRYRQHRPLGRAGHHRPERDRGPAGQEAVREVVEMVVDGGDPAAALPPVGDRSRNVTDQVDDHEREDETS